MKRVQEQKVRRKPSKEDLRKEQDAYTLEEVVGRLKKAKEVKGVHHR